MALEKLKGIQFHDQGVTSFSVDFVNKEICLGISLFNEELNDYDNLSLLFKGVEKLDLGEPRVEELDELNILSFDFKVESRCYMADLLMSLGFGKGLLKINFLFRDLELEK